MQDNDGQLSRKLAEYANKINIVNQELQRLNGVLRSKVDENTSLENRLRSLQL